MSQEETSEGSPRVLGPVTTTSLVAGSMLGIGIFLTPPILAGHLTSLSLFFALWVVGGLAAISGALAYAELGAMMPRAGGDVVFLRAAYGPGASFASGWVIFGAVFTGSIAAMVVPLCQYQLPVLINPALEPLGLVFDPAHKLGPISAAQCVGVVLILTITGVNALGAKLSALVQNLTTVVPVVVFALGAVFALAVGQGAEQAPASVAEQGPGLTAAALAASYMAVYFSYSGWNAVTYVAGEVSSPGRNIPLGLVGGTLLIMALYLLMCWAFIHILGYDGLKNAGEAGTAAAHAMGGDSLGWFMTLIIALGLLGAINGTVLGGARVAYAMARDGAFWSGAGRLSKKTGVPARALWIQGLWASVFVTLGTFEDLLNLVSLAMLVIGALTVGAVYVLRVKLPDTPRPYRVTGYPLTPAFFIVASVGVFGVMVFEAVTKAEPAAFYPLVGVGILPVAYVVHLLFFRHRARP